MKGSLQARALRCQFLDIEGGLVLRRGPVYLRIEGKENALAAKELLAKLGSAGADLDSVLDSFPLPERSVVRGLLARLIHHRFVVPAEGTSLGQETDLDVFYWRFGTSAAETTARLNKQPLTIVGVNHVSRRIATALLSAGWNTFSIVDDPACRNQNLLDSSGAVLQTLWPSDVPTPFAVSEWKRDDNISRCACVIVTSDCGATDQARTWNRYCFEQNRLLLPVMLRDEVGYVGPLVVPGEGPCYECLYARENANMDDADFERVSERVSADSLAVAGFHPAMASVLGEIAAFELIKFYGGGPPRSLNPGTMIEINLLCPQLLTRRVLKIPRCPVCGPWMKTPSTTPYRTTFDSNLGPSS